MAYKIIVSLRTQNDIVNAIDYYQERSEDAPRSFVAQLKKYYTHLAYNPFFNIRYKNVRSLKLKKFLTLCILL